MNGTNAKQKVHSGTQCPPNERWAPLAPKAPFDNDDGTARFGEITFARTFGTTGSITSGFWRVYDGAPGVRFNEKTRSVKIEYPSVSGDETAVVIDGTATITVQSTGETFRIGPGSIISTPEDLKTTWEIDAPYLKTFWVIWRGSQPVKDAPQALKINHINDNPDEWTPYSRSNGKGGELVSGELYMIRDTGSSGFMISGIAQSFSLHLNWTYADV